MEHVDSQGRRRTMMLLGVFLASSLVAYLGIYLIIVDSISFDPVTGQMIQELVLLPLVPVLFTLVPVLTTVIAARQRLFRRANPFQTGAILIVVLAWATWLVIARAYVNVIFPNLW